MLKLSSAITDIWK